VNRTVASFFSIFILPPISRFFPRERPWRTNIIIKKKKLKGRQHIGAGDLLHRGKKKTTVNCMDYLN